MAPKFWTPVASAAASFALASACGGAPADVVGQKSDGGTLPQSDAAASPQSDTGTGEANAQCVLAGTPDITLPDLDTRCYGGANARELLALVAPTYSSTFVPQGAPKGYTWSGSLTPAALTITFTYAGGPITCSAPMAPDCDPPGPCSACGVGPSSIKLPFNVTFKTADGSFNESLSAVVTYQRYSDGYDLINWHATLPLSALVGTYPPMFGDAESFWFEGDLSGAPQRDDGVVSEVVPNQISGGGGAWGE